MGGERDDAPLREWERDVLVRIEEEMARSDPVLARRLRRGPPVRARSRLRAGLALVVLGSVIVMATFATRFLLGLAGLGVMAGGLALVAPSGGVRLTSQGGRTPKGPS